jgi:8-oxo-dGTP diphosphatase
MQEGLSFPPDAASVALVDGERVLLIERARAPFRGHWTLPGGRREPGETALECAVREVREELGLRVEALLPVSTMRAGAFRLQVFTTSRFSGLILPSTEITRFEWVDRHAVDALLTTPGLVSVLQQVFALHN